jgi:hypothetical protein
MLFARWQHIQPRALNPLAKYRHCKQTSHTARHSRRAQRTPIVPVELNPACHQLMMAGASLDSLKHRLCVDATLAYMAQ